MAYRISTLNASTWDDFAELVERNNGIFGGCWCIGYHPECGQRGIDHREVKRERVLTDRAHAALVIDDDGVAHGWCQWGSPDELSGIKHKRAYEKEPPPAPDWRITCIFVDRKHRGQGVARTVLEGALDQIAKAAASSRQSLRSPLAAPRQDDSSSVAPSSFSRSTASYAGDNSGNTPTS